MATDADATGQLYDARICNSISVDLYNLRKHSGLTQEELAEKLGVKQSNISRWERPGYQGYKAKMLSKVVRALGGRLYVGVQPIRQFQYFHETFNMNHESTLTSVNPDGSWQRMDSKFSISYEGVSVHASV